jgi:hypothetical protein
MAIRTELQVGDVVQYSDMANLPRVYVIVALPNDKHPTDYRMVQISGEELDPERWMSHNYSDCRQHGWDLINLGPR